MMGIKCSLTQDHETLHCGHVSRPAPETRWSPARRIQQPQRVLITRFTQHHRPVPRTVRLRFCHAEPYCHCFLTSAARIPARLNSQLVQELPCHRRHYLKQCCVRLFSCISVESDPASFPSSWWIIPWLETSSSACALPSRRTSAEGASFVAVPDRIHSTTSATISFTFSFSSVSVPASHSSTPHAVGTAPTAPQPYSQAGEYTLQTSPHSRAQRSHESAPRRGPLGRHPCRGGSRASGREGEDVVGVHALLSGVVQVCHELLVGEEEEKEKEQGRQEEREVDRGGQSEENTRSWMTMWMSVKSETQT